jgi:hypothetical protein
MIDGSAISLQAEWPRSFRVGVALLGMAGAFLCSPTSGPSPEHKRDNNDHHDRGEDNRLDDVAYFWGWSFRRGMALASPRRPSKPTRR